MKNLSRWASRHLPFAILLIIFCEVINAFNGLLLGANGLADQSAELLIAMALVLLGGAVWVRYRAARPTPSQTYAEGRWLLAGAFGSNFLLFVVLGALWGREVQQPSSGGAVYGSRRVVIRSDTTLRPTQVAYGQTRQESAVGVDRRPSADDPQAGKRIGYVLLFVLGLILTYVSVGLACGLACSGYGFFAVLALALGLGFTAGGIFFLGRAADRPIKPMRELTQPERRRAVRRFWRSWLLLIGLVGALLLIAALS